MKIFYFGSVVDDETFNRIVNNSNIKPSSSAQNFEMALIKGLLLQNDIHLTAVSAASIATFPRSDIISLKKRHVNLLDNLKITILRTLNLPLIKSISHKNGLKKELKKWLRVNKDDANKVVICYGLYPAACKTIIRLSNRYRCLNCCVVTDVPFLTLQYNHPNSIVKRLVLRANVKNATKIQGLFDSYVYLTEKMSAIVAPTKPFIVIETIADVDIFKDIEDINKVKPKAIMYAGTLYKGYGIDLIVDSFIKLKGDFQLWLFGSGDYEEEIKKAIVKDNRIKFFGRVSRKEILKKEKEASLLINLRNPKDDYTKYSFPSKLVEYMLSGTPVLTTKLAGIPKEYDDYLIYTDYSVDAVSNKLDELLRLESLHEIGKKSANFVKDNKNFCVKAKMIYDFLISQLG